MLKSRTATVTRTDDRDSHQKRAYVRQCAADNPDIALRMAEAIALDVTLLGGLGEVVKRICGHERPRLLLKAVFERPGVAKRYPAAFKAFNRNELDRLFTA